jgi:hypothetical protein
MAVISSVWKLSERADDAKYVPRYLKDSKIMYQRHDAIMKSITERVYVWGAGGHTQRMLQYSDMNKLNIEAFIESNTDYYGGRLEGRPIISPLEIDNLYPIIVSSLMYQNAIVEQIKKMGIKNPVVTFY